MSKNYVLFFWNLIFCGQVLCVFHLRLSSRKKIVPCGNAQLFFSELNENDCQKIGERYRVVGADPYCESALFWFDSFLDFFLAFHCVVV